MRFGHAGSSPLLRSLLMICVFAIFAANAIGLMGFQLHFAGSLRLNPFVLSALLDGGLPSIFAQADFIVFVLIGCILALLLPLLAPIPASALTLLAMLPPLYLAWARPLPPPVVPFEYSLLTTLVLFTVNVLVAYFSETHTRQSLMTAFGHYVPPTVVQALSRDPRAFSMAGVAREMSVLFCDIRGFSRLSEELHPRELAELLNRYLTAMTSVLHRHGATIDKYIGDAVMAFWGAPLEQPDHARRAIAAALDMQKRMTTLRDDFERRGWPPIRIGIGINSGLMNVGNMGSRYRVAYTVIGDAVNLAARLEGLTKVYDGEILVSEATRRACPTVVMREIDHVRVRGKGAATRVYEPMMSHDWGDAWSARHAQALLAYYSGDWLAAAREFESLALAAPQPGYYRYMAQRVARDIRPAGWTGVVTYGSELAYAYSTVIELDSERTDPHFARV